MFNIPRKLAWVAKNGKCFGTWKNGKTDPVLFYLWDWCLPAFTYWHVTRNRKSYSFPFPIYLTLTSNLNNTCQVFFMCKSSVSVILHLPTTSDRTWLTRCSSGAFTLLAKVELMCHGSSSTAHWTASSFCLSKPKVIHSTVLVENL